MAKTDKADKAGTAKGVAKGAAAYYALKKVFKGAFVIATVAAVTKVLRSNRAT